MKTGRRSTRAPSGFKTASGWRTSCSRRNRSASSKASARSPGDGRPSGSAGGSRAQSPGGQGLTALFYGASGTGKTLAASVVANELGLPLYRVDLSQLISKYIGETQKNIGRIFDAAESADCILFFDEADALFSRRTEAARRPGPLRQRGNRLSFAAHRAV